MQHLVLVVQVAAAAAGRAGIASGRVGGGLRFRKVAREPCCLCTASATFVSATLCSALESSESAHRRCCA